MAFFNPFRPSYLADPYPALARLRAEEPVHHSSHLDAWIVTSYAACDEVLHDHERFSSDFTKATGRFGAQVARQQSQSLLAGARRMVALDPPEHTRLRRIVSRAFTPREVERMRPIVAEEVDRLLDAVPRGEPFDLVESFARPLPRETVLALLGVPREHRAEVDAWSTAIMATSTRVDLPKAAHTRAREARGELLGYLERMTHEPAAEGTLIATLARATETDAGLTPDELLELTMDLALAGNETTTAWIANGVLLLAAHPEQEAALRAEPELLIPRLEEVIRYEASLQVAVRIAAGPTSLGGCAIGEGEPVIAMLGAANRDPAVFPEPDRFDVTREDAARHLAFGMGPHFCIGAPLARIEAEAAFRALFARTDALALPEGARPERVDDWIMRLVGRLPFVLPTS